MLGQRGESPFLLFPLGNVNRLRPLSKSGGLVRSRATKNNQVVRSPRLLCSYEIDSITLTESRTKTISSKV